MPTSKGVEDFEKSSLMQKELNKAEKVFTSLKMIIVTKSKLNLICMLKERLWLLLRKIFFLKIIFWVSIIKNILKHEYELLERKFYRFPLYPAR